MKDMWAIREANLDDLAAISQVLKQSDLLALDALAPGTRYWIAEDGEGHALGCAGMEFGNAAVLLRSVAVLPAFRKRGLGEQLMNCALVSAASQGYRRVYLFSMRSGGYWQRLGFYKVDPQEVVRALPDCFQVKRFESMPGKLAAETGWRKDLPGG